MSNSNRQTLDTYNSSVVKYIETSPQVVAGDLKDWIDENLSKLDANAKILEIGSGSGKDADYFESKGFKTELTDASQGFVDYLNKKGKKARLLDILNDELESDYDMIFADAVFLHFNRNELKHVLQKVHEALKPNGRIVFSLKAGTGEEITNRKLGAKRYFCFWEQDAIEALLKELSFGQVQTKVIDDYRGKARPDWLLISAVNNLPGDK